MHRHDFPFHPCDMENITSNGILTPETEQLGANFGEYSLIRVIFKLGYFSIMAALLAGLVAKWSSNHRVTISLPVSQWFGLGPKETHTEAKLESPPPPPCPTAPWPGNTYTIMEKGTDEAITITQAGLRLQHIKEGRDGSNQWLCVERNGYFAFQNPKTGFFMGHDGNCGVRASARIFEAWEAVTPRSHPDGGFQLLVPHWWHTLRVITVAEDDENLVTRLNGTTLWEFVKM